MTDEAYLDWWTPEGIADEADRVLGGLPEEVAVALLAALPEAIRRRFHPTPEEQAADEREPRVQDANEQALNEAIDMVRRGRRLVGVRFAPEVVE